MHKPAETSVNIHPLFASRWSPLAFDANSLIPPHVITALKESARWSPSCYGAEPWRFVFCHKSQNETAWLSLLNALAPPNQTWAENAPLLILACAQTHFEHNNNPNKHCGYDTGAAALALVLEAENNGLRCHQMGGFDSEKAAKALAVPDGFDCFSVIAVGKQTTHQKLPDDLQEREQSSRKRQPLNTRFFDGKWGESNE